MSRSDFRKVCEKSQDLESLVAQLAATSFRSVQRLPPFVEHLRDYEVVRH